ncbi:MAG: recombination mediator RecR [Alphaproteobacteria bacterium]
MQDGALHHLIKMLSQLPGLGSRSARRVALHLLSKRESAMLPLAAALKTAAEQVKDCTTCGNLDTQVPCGICRDDRRDRARICVVAGVSDVWAIERTGAYKGLYHVLGGLLSALDGVGPDNLRIGALKFRAENTRLDEIIIALSATVDGQSTAHYIADALRPLDVKVTYLSHGVPVGGELDYLDDGTITTALKARRAV